MNQNSMECIPVLRPQLPTVNSIAPYLEQIDRSRWYSNFGPLLNKFEQRLAAHFGVEPTMITTAANGTLMLLTILKSLQVPENTVCVLPSWTFVATAAAICYAGMIPYFVDVDPVSQALDPTVLKTQLAQINQPIGAVMAVAPFGAPIDRERWDNFSDETGIPVVIDAAAAFDTVGRMLPMSVGKSPMMVSLHATKVLGIGEGGMVLSTNTALIKQIKLMTTFGFNGNREARSLGINAKLSEYSAAIGHAALDSWKNTRTQWERVRDWYLEQFATLGVDHWLFPEWVGSTCNIILPGNADTMAVKLSEQGIDTRKWWSTGCHKEQAYVGYPRAVSLKNTERLGRSVLGLPMAVDLDSPTIIRICHALASILEDRSFNQIAHMA